MNWPGSTRYCGAFFSAGNRQFWIKAATHWRHSSTPRRWHLWASLPVCLEPLELTLRCIINLLDTSQQNSTAYFPRGQRNIWPHIVFFFFFFYLTGTLVDHSWRLWCVTAWRNPEMVIRHVRSCCWWSNGRCAQGPEDKLLTAPLPFSASALPVAEALKSHGRR